MTFQIAMDSAGDIPEDWIGEYDIHIIPINIHFGEQMFLQGVDLSNADFYRIVEESGVIPKTSQPTPRQFVDFYRSFAQPGDTILSMHVTGKLSGTLASAELAARELENEFNVIPVDSAGGSAEMGYMCQEARLMERRAGYRNRLVHFYDEVTPAELYRICTERVSDVRVILHALRTWVQEHPEHVDRSL